MTISSLLVANRGEIAVRIARTCRELGIRSVAVFSEPDRSSLHVAACDEAIAIGGDTPATSYLRLDAILAAAHRAGVDAIHPGFGFLAENADAARAVLDAGFTWVGPSPEAIAAMGDKIVAKERMAAAGVPVLPGLVLDGAADLDDVAARVGFPVIVKAAAGGGGKGMRVVRDPAALEAEVAAARREAAGAFGDDRVFVERYVARPRHVEVQVLGEADGTVRHLFERECSIQRRHQKVVEEAPAPTLPPAVRDRLLGAAVAAAEAIDYRNAGTVEFVVDDDALAAGRHDEAVFFLEMNTRLQVEHPVTEAVTGVDLVRLQLLVADGQPTGLGELAVDGHAIEVRLYAEDPANDYLPATGTLAGFRPAPGVRWDTGVREGDVVSPFYDPMIAKVVAHAPTRREAAARLAAALRTTVIQGVVTNRDLLVAVLGDEAFLAGETTTAFLAERYPDHDARTFRPAAADVTAALLAVVADDLLRAQESATVLRTLAPGFAHAGLGGEASAFTVAGRDVRVAHEHRRGGDLVEVDGEVHALDRWERDGDGLVYEVDGHRRRAVVHTAGTSVQVVLPRANVTLYRHPRFPEQRAAAEAGATLAPMPGAVVHVLVEPGQDVVAGDVLVTVEAMKMEHKVVAPTDGTVADVRVVPGQQVDAGDVLVVVAAPGDEPD